MGRKAALPSRGRTTADIGRRIDDFSLPRRELADPRAGNATTGKARKRGPQDAVLNRPGTPEGDATSREVVDNLPEGIPILPRELDAIEAYLGNLLDQMPGCEQEP